MLLDYAYLLKNFDIEFFNGANRQARNFIIPIDEKIIDEKHGLFKTLHNSKDSFCFYIPAEINRYSQQYIKEEIIINLVRLLFLPNYLRINRKYILLIERVKGEQKSLKLLRNEFYNELKKQGIITFMIDLLPADPSLEEISGEQYMSMIPSDLNNYLRNGEQESSFEAFTKSFTFSPAHFDKKWIVPVTGFDDFEHKVRRIENFERWMTLAQPGNVKLIEMYKVANRNKERLNSENNLLKLKLDESVNYLQLIRQESQAFFNEITRLRLEIQPINRQVISTDNTFILSPTNNSDNHDYIVQLQTQIAAEQNRAHEILEWYKKEYEVLPLWYKKFGHIIKVLIGKRTFKSLFK